MKDRPDFDDIVGGELEPSERDRLLRIHDLLVAAGPPPELSSSLVHPPTSATVAARRRRSRVEVLAFAAAVGVILFAIGFLAGDRADEPGTFQVVAMTGTPEAAAARASIVVFDADEAGNWPMELDITGLSPSPDGRLYELWLTKGDRLGALCGGFLAEPDGSTVVPLNAPYRLRDYDGWVVVEEGSSLRLLST